MLTLANNLGWLGRLTVLLFARMARTLMYLYFYCLKRFQENLPIKLIGALRAVSAGWTAVIEQRRVCQPVHDSQLSVHEFDVVAVAGTAV